MIVYIAEGHIDYEGFEILGIYLSKEEAEDRVNEVMAATSAYDEFHVNKYKIGDDTGIAI